MIPSQILYIFKVYCDLCNKIVDNFAHLALLCWVDLLDYVEI